MNTPTKFQVGDIVNCSTSGRKFEVVDVDAKGNIKLKGFEYYYKSEHFTLHKRVCNNTEEAKPPKWRIESDGSAYGTFLWIDGEEVRGIVDLDFSAGVDKTPMLQLTMVHDPGYK